MANTLWTLACVGGIVAGCVSFARSGGWGGSSGAGPGPLDDTSWASLASGFYGSKIRRGAGERAEVASDGGTWGDDEWEGQAGIEDEAGARGVPVWVPAGLLIGGIVALVLWFVVVL